MGKESLFFLRHLTIECSGYCIQVSSLARLSLFLSFDYKKTGFCLGFLFVCTYQCLIYWILQLQVWNRWSKKKIHDCIIPHARCSELVCFLLSTFQNLLIFVLFIISRFPNGPKAESAARSPPVYPILPGADIAEPWGMVSGRRGRAMDVKLLRCGHRSFEIRSILSWDFVWLFSLVNWYKTERFKGICF